MKILRKAAFVRRPVQLYLFELTVIFQTVNSYFLSLSFSDKQRSMIATISNPNWIIVETVTISLTSLYRK